MALLRIRDATASGKSQLRLTLTDGSVIERDISTLLIGPLFEPLKRNRELFAQVRVEDGAVVWPNGADLCPDVLIWNGPPPDDREASIEQVA